MGTASSSRVDSKLRAPLIADDTYHEKLLSGVKEHLPLSLLMGYPLSRCERAGETALGGQWEVVKKKLEQFPPLAFVVGDSKERWFSCAIKGKDMSVVKPGASIGKWMSTIAIAGVVAEGHLTFDTRASEVLPYWTKDPLDVRSRVSLRHLLTFTSGFRVLEMEGFAKELQASHDPHQFWCLNGLSTFTSYNALLHVAKHVVPGMGSVMSCAQLIYERATHGDEPGIFYDYNSYHLEIAMEMAAQASGLPAATILQKYLYDPFRLNHTKFSLGYESEHSQPSLGLGLMSNGDDIDSFLRGYLAREALPQAIYKQLDTEYVTAQNVTVRNDTVSKGRPIRWAMSHYQTDIYRPRTGIHMRMLAPVSYFIGSSGWTLFIDPSASIYIAMLPNERIVEGADPIAETMADIYSAMNASYIPKKMDVNFSMRKSQGVRRSRYVVVEPRAA